MKKFLTFCTRFTGWGLLLVFGLAAGLIVWFQTAPPALNFLNPHIQAHLKRFEPEYRIAFDTVRLSWPGWQFNPRVRIDDIRVQRLDAPVLRIPDLLVTLDLGRLLRREIAPVRITVESPRLRLTALGVGGMETPETPEPDTQETLPETITRTLARALFALPSLRDREPDLRMITIEDALLVPEETGDGSALRIPEVSLAFHSAPSGDLNLTLNGETAFGKTPSRFQLISRISSDKGTAETELHGTGLDPSTWAGFIPGTERIREYHLPFNIHVGGTVYESGRITSGEFSVSNSGGRISDPDLFEQPVRVEKFQARGRFSTDLTRWTLEKCIMQLDGPSLSVSGNIMPFGEFPTVLLDAQVEEVSLADVERYWPRPLEPKVRKWIITHFLAGEVDKATARFRFHPTDFKARPLPKETLDVTVFFEEVTIDYHDPMAEIRKISGTARFSGHGVGIEVHGGRTYDTDIEKGRVDIQWIPGRPEIDIQATAAGPADGLRQAVGDLIEADDLPLRIAEGSARTELRFRFPLKDFTPDEFVYEVESDLSDLLAPSVFGFTWSQEALSVVLQSDLLKVFGAGGRVSRPDTLARPVEIPEFRMKGLIPKGPPGVEVAAFSADLGGPMLHASGHVLMHTDHPDIDLNVEVDRLTLPDAVVYWPLGLAEDVRDWIASRFSAGEIVNARVRLNLEPRHFTLAQLPPNAVEAEIPFKGVSLDYFPTLPTLKNADGTATLTADAIRIQVNQAEIRRSRLVNGQVNILGWDTEAPILKIRSILQGPANDLIETIAGLTKQTDPNLPRFDSASAETRLKIELPLGDEISPGDLKISAAADIDAVRMADFYGFQIDDGYLRTSLEAGKVTLTGGVRTDSIPFDIEGRFTLPEAAESNGDSETGGAGEGEIQLNATLHARDLPQLGIPPLPFLEGSAETTTRIRIAPSADDITLTADLQHTRIDLSPLGWRKPPGQKATLEIHAQPEGKNGLRFSMIHFFADGARISGFGDIQTGPPARAEFHFDQVELGRNRFKLVYAFADGNSDLSIRGNTLDAAPLITRLTAEAEEETTAEKEDAFSFPGTDAENGFSGTLQADLKEMLMGNGRILNDLTARTHWQQGRLLTANLEAAFSKGEEIRIGFSPQQTGRLLSIHSANGGKLLNSLNLSENLVGGELDVSAHFAGPIPTDQPARADVSLRRFTLVNAPHLMQILSMASFVGLVGQLQSGGIQFDLLQALLTYENSVLTLEEAGMEGISLGITAEGTLDLTRKNLDVDGMVIPFNVLNRIVDKIPLVGKFIVGEGIIATRYSLDGPYRRPNVSIKPLSTLQMGFLRDIFSKFKLHRLDSSADPSSHPRTLGR